MDCVVKRLDCVFHEQEIYILALQIVILHYAQLQYKNIDTGAKSTDINEP